VVYDRTNPTHEEGRIIMEPFLSSIYIMQLITIMGLVLSSLFLVLHIGSKFDRLTSQIKRLKDDIDWLRRK